MGFFNKIFLPVYKVYFRIYLYIGKQKNQKNVNILHTILYKYIKCRIYHFYTNIKRFI